MIILSNDTEQTLAPGQSMTFNTVIVQAGHAECHRRNTGSVKMRCTGVYDIDFGANITGTAAGAVELSIQLGGTTMPETTMIVTPAAAGDFFNVSRSTSIKNCCGDYDTVTITNTSDTATVVVGVNPILKIRRAG